MQVGQWADMPTTINMVATIITIMDTMQVIMGITVAIIIWVDTMVVAHITIIVEACRVVIIAVWVVAMTVVVTIAHRGMEVIWAVQKALMEQEPRQAVNLWPITTLVTLME